ncbi:MAG: hypothetical protein KC731_18505 [Myxococcales bacterium]|nr:hypothetical protein [Myxococcales bacterium]
MSLRRLAIPVPLVLRFAPVSLAVLSVGCGASPSKVTPPVRDGARPGVSKLYASHLGACLVVDAERTACWGPLPSDTVPEPMKLDGFGPRLVPELAGVRSLAMGMESLCKIEATGEVSCVTGPEPWGRIAGVGRASGVGVGYQGACAIAERGAVRCWTSGGTSAEIEGVVDAIALSAGVNHACALRADGQVLCWGESNEAGMLGDGGHDAHLAARPVVDLADVVAISGRKLHTCALRRDGTVWCWGLGDDGQLGDGVPREVDGHASRPVRARDLDEVTAIAAGNGHTCALRRDGIVWCWGSNQVGQVGATAGARCPVPTRVPGLDDVVEIAAGGGHQCALRANGEVRCWGASFAGQAGVVADAVLEPTMVALP